MKKYIKTGSQSDIILKYMQNHHLESVEASTFMHGDKFVGYEASARLSELKSMGLIEKVGKIKNRNLYRLTSEGVNYMSEKPRFIRCEITFNGIDMSDEILRRSQKKSWSNLFGLLN